LETVETDWVETLVLVADTQEGSLSGRQAPISVQGASAGTGLQEETVEETTGATVLPRTTAGVFVEGRVDGRMAYRAMEVAVQ
jgi:hypothetical protein